MPDSSSDRRRNESSRSPNSPKKEIVKKVNMKRNTKFHNLFKDLPPDEICIKGYSCAFVGDILIQGYLYISPNWFCFHSRILLVEKQIKIPVHKVLNITREKTAIFIPNAIGVVTSEDKYVFGSLLSRDTTFRIMFTVWKTLTMQGDAKSDLAELELRIDETERNNNVRSDNASIDSSGSEDSMCNHCGLPVTGHTRLPCEAMLTDDAEVNVPPPTPTSHNTDAPSNESVSLSGTSPGGAGGSADNKSLVTQSSSAISQGDAKQQQQSVISRLQSSIRPSSPQSQTLLIICVVMVFFLSLSAVIMLYKILVLQAQMDSSEMPLPLDGEGMYGSVYYLNQNYHTTAIKRFHSVLEANVHVLDQIFHSLRGLQSSIKLSETAATGSSCEAANQCDDTVVNDVKPPS